MAVKHGVAVGAHGTKVGVRVHHVLPAHDGKRDYMMHLNEALSEVPVDGPEVESAHRAPDALPSYTGLPGSRIALVCVHEDQRGSPLHTARPSGDLFSRDR